MANWRVHSGTLPEIMVDIGYGKIYVTCQLSAPQKVVDKATNSITINELQLFVLNQIWLKASSGFGLGTSQALFNSYKLSSR